jgi:hypothetical protein
MAETKADSTAASVSKENWHPEQVPPRWWSLVAQTGVVLSILWIAFKDWSFFKQPGYPVADSLLLSTAIVVAALSTFLVAFLPRRQTAIPELLADLLTRYRWCSRALLTVGVAICLLSITHIFDTTTTTTVHPQKHKASLAAVMEFSRRLTPLAASALISAEARPRRRVEVHEISSSLPMLAALALPSAIALIALGMPFPLVKKVWWWGKGRDKDDLTTRDEYLAQWLAVAIGMVTLIDPRSLVTPQQDITVYSYSPLDWVSSLEGRLVLCGLIVLIAVGERVALKALLRRTASEVQVEIADKKTSQSPLQKRYFAWDLFYMGNTLLALVLFYWFGPSLPSDSDLQSLFAPPMDLHALLVGNGIAENLYGGAGWMDCITQCGLITLLVGAVLLISSYFKNSDRFTHYSRTVFQDSNALLTPHEAETLEAYYIAVTQTDSTEESTRKESALQARDAAALMTAAALTMFLTAPICIAGSRLHGYSWVVIGCISVAFAVTLLAIANQMLMTTVAAARNPVDANENESGKTEPFDLAAHERYRNARRRNL